MRILLLHAYSAHNRGDGLLVDESVALIRSVFDDVELEVVASDPDSFSYLGVPVYNAKPGRRGWSREYLRVLRNLDSYDLLVGVGGGYLRAGKPLPARREARGDAEMPAGDGAADFRCWPQHDPECVPSAEHRPVPFRLDSPVSGFGETHWCLHASRRPLHAGNRLG